MVKGLVDKRQVVLQVPFDVLRAANDTRREKARIGAVLEEQTGNRTLFSLPDVGNRRIKWRLLGPTADVRIGTGLE